MKTKTIVSFFSGGGGFDIGAMLAGFKPIGAYEYIPEIAAVYRQNLGDHVNCMSILGIHKTTLEIKKANKEKIKYFLELNRRVPSRYRVNKRYFRHRRAYRHLGNAKLFIKNVPTADLFHFSPPCPNFSNAKKDKGETENDLELSQKVCDIISFKKPNFVTLENVYGYRKSKSFKMLLKTLTDLGYGWQWWHLNAANYGVPQTRKRLILIARKDGQKPKRPTPTHEKEPRPLFGLKKWVGWYEAIEDLIPTLEPSKFAPWQLEKMPEWFKWDRSVISEQSAGGDRDLIVREAGETAGTLTTGKGGRVLRAFIAQPDNASTFKTMAPGEPVGTIVSSLNNKIPIHKAFIMNAANPNGNEKRKFRTAEEPAKTTTSGDSTAIKGFIPHSHANSNTAGVESHEPSYTIRAQKQPERALIIPGGNSTSARPREGGESSQTIGDVNRVGNIPRVFTPFTMTTQGDIKPIYHDQPIETPRSAHTHTRNAYTIGRVVKLNITALARLQSFPDWYQWPQKEKRVKCVISGKEMYRYVTVDKKTLSCTIIGNSVPPLMAAAICNTL